MNIQAKNMKKTRTAQQKIIAAVIPVLLVALAIFFVNNWQGGLATKIEVSEKFAKKAEIKTEYVTIAQHNVGLGKIESIGTKVDEVHDDVKLVLLGIATMHPELMELFLKTAKKPLNFPPRPKAKKNDKAYAENGG